MSTAILYIRVSTDEQAIKGYSQRYQQEHLEKYCMSHDIQVLDVIFEDHSAKNFDRPSWEMMMMQLKRHKTLRPNLLLFTKWDRFSRNAGDAYYVIKQLHNMGMIPQAIDQELDLSIPENKILLAVYLATSEAENERRSLNIKQGIYKAKKEGRWISSLPMGYSYCLLANGKKGIVPNQPEATWIRMAFSMISEHSGTLQSIYEKIIQSGLKCSISNFCRVVRNPVYCGKIQVPPFGSEPGYLANGIHQPIVEENLFLKVQEILNNKKHKPILKNCTNEHLQLRGFLNCPICSRLLTGSGSKGRYSRYYYYHCSHKCKFRIRADQVNLLFQENLNGLVVADIYLDFYKEIIESVRRDLFPRQEVINITVIQSIDRLIERILKAKELLIQGEIEYDDFTIIKRDCEQRIHSLGTAIQKQECLEKNRRFKVEKAVGQLAQLGKVFQHLDVKKKTMMLKVMIKPSTCIVENLNMEIMLNEHVKLVFSMKGNLYDEHNSQPMSQKSYIQDDKFSERIIEIEKQRNTIISRKRAEYIADFLILFAKITLDIE